MLQILNGRLGHHRHDLSSNLVREIRPSVDDGLQAGGKISVSCAGCIGFCSAGKWCIL